MSVILPVTTDTLPTNVPKLDIKGANWAIFSLRFQVAVEAKELWSHFDGTSLCPVAMEVTASDGTVTTTPPDADELAKWLKSENLAKHLLTQRVPDSTALRIRNLPNVASMWNEIVREYTEKGAYAQTDLRTKFLESQCPAEGDVRQFLDDLRTKRDELAAVGVLIEEKDYRSTIIQSLPKYLASFASGQLATACLYSPTQTIDPDLPISLVIEEAERRNRKETRQAHSKPKSRSNDDSALAVAPGTSFSRGRGSGRGGQRGGSFRGRGRQRPPCWNCGSRSHFKSKCPEPEKQKTDGGSKNESAHLVELDSEDDGFFAVTGLCMTDEDLLTDVLSVSSDDSDDERSYLFPGMLSVSSVDEDLSSLADIDDWSSDVGDDPSETTDHLPVVAIVTTSDQGDKRIVELYDSGSTRHISPYRDQFETLSPIPPKSLAAANKQSFEAVGVGEMVVEVPNSLEVSKLRLTEVLYSPEVGYTLVSIGRLDQLGYAVTFADGTCIIRNSADDIFSRISQSKAGLYRVIHEPDHGSSNAVTERISVMELHCRLGHISPAVAKRLAESGLISGLKIDLSANEPTFCESCVYAKATRKPIAKERIGERAEEFAEVHTDVWSPAPVETLGGRRYYISFTDDKTRLTYIHFLRQKSKAFSAYKDFEAWSQTQHGARVKTLHSDRGGEYLGKEFIMHLKSAGTTQKLTVHDTPQHNGVAERLNRTLLERACAMIHDSGLPRFLWGEAVRHAVWLKNRTPTKALQGATPLEVATGKLPDFSRLRPWGSKVWVRTEGGDKLGGRVAIGCWVGVDDDSPNGCRVFWPSKRSVTVERNVYWDPSVTETSHREGEEEDCDHSPGMMYFSREIYGGCRPSKQPSTTHS